MHEMSLALDIVDVAVEKAMAAGGCRINEVELEVGALAGVLKDSLEFCFEAAAKGTLAADASLRVVEVGGQGRCSVCEQAFPVASLFAACPQCGEYLVTVTHGKDLRIVSITVDE